MDRLDAVVFDVDGTIADTERHGHRVAFNMAFEAVGLEDRWDEELYGRLLAVPGGKERLDHHLASRGVPAGERARIVPALHERKNAFFLELMREGAAPLRPGVARLLDELAAAGVPVAVATTGSRPWVVELLGVLLGEERRGRFAAVVTGEDVRRQKPDPEVYLLTLERLGADPERTAAVEDSEPGLRAALGAGLACLVVRNGYTMGHDFAGAALVVDSLGEPGQPATVVANPHGVEVEPLVGPSTLGRLVAARRGAGG